MQVLVEVGNWQHACCGPAYERGAMVEITCLAVPGVGADGRAPRHVETHHDDLSTRHPQVRLRGRVADVAIRHPDGVVEPILRLPGGRALRGFDDADDGHLEQPWSGLPVAADSETYLLTLET